MADAAPPAPRTAYLLYAIPVLAALAQLTWMPRLPWAAYPNLAVVTVAAWTWSRGTRAGLWWAVAAGLVLDLGSGGALGPHALALLAAAYVAGLVTTTIDGGLLTLPASAGLATVAYGAALLVIGAVLRESSLHVHANAGWIFGTSIWSAVLAPLAVLVVRRLDRAVAAVRW
ncbi:MAG TPA: rod shape-determining protein MreD [Candidatus Dormibacteraeota bacterium]